MTKRLVYIIAVMLSCSTYHHALEIKSLGIIPIDQEKVILQRVIDFCVTEGEQFIFPDMKAGDIKIYDNKGNLIKVWGRKGPGPNEFLYPAYCDYQKPYFSLMDYGKNKLFVYELDRDMQFRKLSESLVLSLGYDIKIINPGKILISGYKADSEGKKYDLYFSNPATRQTTLLLRSHEKYGYSSQKEYNKHYLTKVAPIGIAGYCDYLKENIYFVWAGNLKILKIGIDSKEISSFGTKTKNYITPVVTSRLKKLYDERGRELKYEMQKISYVTGVFADDGFVGLTYANFKKESEGWQTIVQFYTTDGKLLLEKILPGAINTTKWADPSFCYDKDKNVFYYLSRTMDEEFDDIFKILKFKVSL